MKIDQHIFQEMVDNAFVIDQSEPTKEELSLIRDINNQWAVHQVDDYGLNYAILYERGKEQGRKAELIKEHQTIADFVFDWDESGVSQFMEKHADVCLRLLKKTSGKLAIHFFSMMPHYEEGDFQFNLFFPQSGIPAEVTLDLATGKAKATVSHCYAIATQEEYNNTEQYAE